MMTMMMRMVIIRLARVEHLIDEMNGTIPHYPVGEGDRYAMSDDLGPVRRLLVRQVALVLELKNIHIKRVVGQQGREGQVLGVDNLGVGETMNMVESPLRFGRISPIAAAHHVAFVGMMTMEGPLGSVVIKIICFDILKSFLSVEVRGYLRDRLRSIVSPVCGEPLSTIRFNTFV